MKNYQYEEIDIVLYIILFTLIWKPIGVAFLIIHILAQYAKADNERRKKKGHHD